MSTAVRPQKQPILRSTTVDSSSSSANSTNASSPAQSPSSTSLSSLDSVDDLPLKNQRGRLVDGYGNEFKVPDYTIKQIRDAIPAHCFERSAATGLYYVARDISLSLIHI